MSKLKTRWKPFSVELNYEELETIITALSIEDKNPKLRKELELTARDIWRYLP